MNWIFDLIAATLRTATPLVFGTIGETYAERAGILNLGIEGTMYAGAFSGFAAAYLSGSLLVGLVVAIVVGIAAGAVMGVLTVTLGANQHVSGLGLTIALVGLSEFAQPVAVLGLRLRRSSASSRSRRWDPLRGLGDVGAIFSQYGLTYVAFLVVAPVAWWVLGRTPLGLSIRAVGENPEAADAAGINVARIRYLALMIGGALMAIGGAFITLAVLGSFTLDIIAGRGWVCIALVIFGRWRIWRGVGGALIFAAVFSLGLRLRIMPGRRRGATGAAARAAVPRGHRGARHLGPQRGLSRRVPQAISEDLTMDDQRAIDEQLPGGGHRAGPYRPRRGRRAHRWRPGRRRQGARRRPQPTGAAGLAHPARRDRCPRGRRATAGVGLPPGHDVHDAVALRHVHRRHPAVRHPAGRAGRERDVHGRRGLPALARRGGREPRVGRSASS